MKFQKFDYLVWSIVGLLGAGILVALWLNTRIGVRVLRTFPEEGGQIGVAGEVGIEFADFMQPGSVEELVRIEPELEGSFRWDAKTVWFDPAGAFIGGQTYTMTLLPGGLSESGGTVKEALTWTFEVRPPRVIFLDSRPDMRDLLWIPVEGGAAQRLTDTGGRVFDYAVSPDGTRIVYSATDDLGGIDLWILEVAAIPAGGGLPPVSRLLACSPDRCSTPAWSPDGGRIAYSHQRVGAQIGSYSLPRIWVLEVESSETAPLYTDEQILGYSPSWSPAGGRLGFYAQTSPQIRILDLATGDESLLPSSTGGVGSWSPDGARMLFNDVLADAAIQSIFLANVEFPSVSVLVSGEKMEAQWLGQPAWSPDGEWFVFAVGFLEGGRGNQLWLMPINASYGQVLADERDFYYYNYHWEPSSRAIAYQRLDLSDPSALPEIVVWSIRTWTSTMVVEGGVNPGWVP
ncbi:MAG TPA: hypothetical protein VMN57_08610 [Anaerolineales bacterium]|nr:hypothetical protein [Anaerolineales bacterium]